jgi:leucyl-tRNA synthetase
MINKKIDKKYTTMQNKQIENYNFLEVEEKWQKHWEQNGGEKFDETSSKPKYYNLEMLPYPSGKLHMGHVRNYTIGDVLARYKRLMGYNVIYPFGWDAFGLPAENAAMESKSHPATWTYQNIDFMKKQVKAMGFSHDWNREIATCSPEYYKHEQKMFIDFFNAGLAYRKESMVNWDPIDQTVLSNEQVVDGKGWRSGAVVEKKKLNQWCFAITKYTEELLADLDTLTGWPEKVRTMQREWIGKSDGAIVNFTTEDGVKMPIFTTRPDTLFGASFVAISPFHPLINTLPQSQIIKDFVDECKKGGVSELEIANKEKLGLFAGLYCINPLNNEKLPVYIANFVLMEYGTGAIFGCPAVLPFLVVCQSKPMGFQST